MALFAILAGPCCLWGGDLSLRLSWQKDILTVAGEDLPGKELNIWYLEAYCRPGSTDRDWRETVIGHQTHLVDKDPQGKWLRLKCRLNDGVVVDHHIRVVADGVEFRVKAHNPTRRVSQAHWAQPCIRVDRFTGCDQQEYLQKCFVFLDGRLERLPTPGWATKARYTPGQVWAAPGVSRQDVNPRPLNSVTPSNGLVGCVSQDEKMLLAVAWEPYQELFQGVIVCIHSDFRLGGLRPKETKRVKGRMYIMENDVKKLLGKYEKDFAAE